MVLAPVDLAVDADLVVSDLPVVLDLVALDLVVSDLRVVSDLAALMAQGLRVAVNRVSAVRKAGEEKAHEVRVDREAKVGREGQAAAVVPSLTRLPDSITIDFRCEASC